MCPFFVEYQLPRPARQPLLWARISPARADGSRSPLDRPVAQEEPEPALSAMAAMLASFRFLTSPCLPFCVRHSLSAPSSVRNTLRHRRHVHSPTSARNAVPTRLGAQRPLSCPPSDSGARYGRRLPGSGCSCWRESGQLGLLSAARSARSKGCVAKAPDSRQTSGLPREHHFEGR